ncbi:MAG TPA: hypothetical protein VGT40_22990 [Methylomirabilota bacterium]|jgi:hypothetical protein|nr:hypothetical protein [Methylomirabilota bacterium]
MTSVAIFRIGSAVLAALAVPVWPAWAQVPVTPTPGPTPTPMAPPAGGDAAGGGALFVVLMIALFAVIGIGVKLYDLKRKRSDEAMHLQARIADALMQDPALATLPVAATAHAPFWRGTPMTIEVTGHVPTPHLRDAAMNVVLAEASRAGVEFHVEDRLSVVQHVGARAA